MSRGDDAPPRAAVVLVAGGIGSRIGAPTNKVYLPIRQRAILLYSLETLSLSPSVTEVVIVVRPGDTDVVASLLEAPLSSEEAPGPTRIRTAHGGATRHDSEWNGIVALRPEIEAGEVDVVAVHDGARPFASLALVERVLTRAGETGGAIPGSPIEGPLYSLDENRFVAPSDHAWAQTPQAFAAPVLLDAHTAARRDGFSGKDTAEVVQRYSSQSIALVPGDPRNIKVTFQADLDRAEILAGGWRAGAWT